MPITHGNNEPANLYVGSNPVQKLYRGNQQVWPAPVPAPGGGIDFAVYAKEGSDATDKFYSVNRIHDGDIIEMVAPGRLQIIYKYIGGAVTNDVRRLQFDTDYGERYNAQYLEHNYLPTGFTTMDTTGAELGRYPGFTSGHVFRGVNMSGARVLTHDYPGDGGPVGTCDRTVTCTVSDGVSTSQLTFTVRLVDPLRYYTDSNGATYIPSKGGARRGCIFISRDGDFTGAPTGASTGLGNIYHLTLPSGEFTQSTFSNSGGGKDIVRHNANGTTENISDFPWVWYQSWTAGVFFKAGEVWYPTDRLNQLGHLDGQMSSWGDANGGKAILDGERLATWSTNPRTLFQDNGSADYKGFRFHNMEVKLSDFDQSQEVWREWWNILYYDPATKVGTFTENSNGAGFNGDIVTNAATTAYTQIIKDNGDHFITRQVVTGSNAQSGQQAYFSDGDVLTSPTGSVTFVAASSRQDRTKKTPPGFMSNPGAQGGGNGPAALVIDNCTFRGGPHVLGMWPRSTIVSDVLIKDFWNYGIGSGDAFEVVFNAVVCVLDSAYRGTARVTGVGVHPLRNEFNIPRADDPTQPAENRTSHAAVRFGQVSALAMYKCGIWFYGGHSGVAEGHQPAIRMPTSGVGGDNQIYLYIHGCFFAGGTIPLQMFSLASANTVYTPRGIVIDQTWLRGNHATAERMFAGRLSNLTIKNSRIGWSPGPVRSIGNRDWQFIQFDDSTFDNGTDANAVSPQVENNVFEYLADTVQIRAMLGFDTNLRSIPVQYSGNVINVDETKFTSVGPFIQDGD